jgi:hypothetical protein
VSVQGFQLREERVQKEKPVAAPFRQAPAGVSKNLGEAGLPPITWVVADSPRGGDLMMDKPKDQPKPWQPGGGQGKSGQPQPNPPKK